MKLSHLTAAAVLILTACNPQKQTYESVPTNDDVILHAWSWSFDTIAANMKTIADAGYTYVQTSPAQTCLVGDNGGMALMSQPGDSVMGKWYYYYQPTDWQIGNYALGNRESLKAMCDSAEKYNVKVIVDVLPNHTAMDETKVLASLDSAVGGHENLYHANGRTPITDYNDRFQCTTGEMGGLKDVNTENPAFQKYYMQYVNDLLSLGVRGFRYDTAKHIGLPSDPKDEKSPRNNFWDVATGRESVDSVNLALPADSLFIYGEVLQDKNVKETEYAEYMGLTASNYGHALRHVLETGNAKADSLADWRHPASPDKLVTWVESHDTYCNQNESATLTDEQIRAGWVFLAARQYGTPLFFSRPAGSTRQNYWGNNRIGARGNDEFFHPEVVAANKFRKHMSGCAEKISYSDDGTIAAISRADAGIAIVNFSDRTQTFDFTTDIPNGTYVDTANGQTIHISDGHITGTLSPYESCIVENM